MSRPLSAFRGVGYELNIRMLETVMTPGQKGLRNNVTPVEDAATIVTARARLRKTLERALETLDDELEFLERQRYTGSR